MTEKLKAEMISDLKKQNIGEDINALWYNAKAWAKRNGYIMGGSYASVKPSISVDLLIEGSHHRFKVSLDDVSKNEFNPNWCSPPGDTIEETMEYYKITIGDLSKTTGIPEKTIELLIQGEAELTDDIAQKLDEALKIDKQFWINREKTYRDGLAKGLKVWPKE